MSFRLLQACCIWMLVSSCLVTMAQSLPPSTSGPALSQDPGADQPTYRLHTGTRAVLTDVVVQDRDGNPVHGLPRSAFRITDNGREQSLTSFEEHSVGGEVVRSQVSGPNAYSNDYLVPPPAALNVLLLDTTNLEIADQMYLREELDRFVAELPPGTLLAVFSRSGEFLVVQQSFTADRALLARAISHTVPRLPDPNRQDVSDLDTLTSVIAHLDGLPGRKNVLWFSGGSRLFLMPDASSMPEGMNLQPVYDALNSNRIALYPIDARGLTVGSGPGQIAQHQLMRDMADATGGLALLNRNDLGALARSILSTDHDFYTLTYAPHEVKLDNRWHKVRVQVEGHYTLSYRQGYFDDGSTLKSPDRTGRKLLTAGGRTDEQHPPSPEPIVFSVVLRPFIPGGEGNVELPRNAPPPAVAPKGSTTFLIHYKVSVASFEVTHKEGVPIANLGTALLVLNSFGETVHHDAWQVTFNLDPKKLAAHPNGTLEFDEPVTLPKGTDHLAVAVWDPVTRRMGRLELPVDVAKQQTAAQ